MHVYHSEGPTRTVSEKEVGEMEMRERKQEEDQQDEALPFPNRLFLLYLAITHRR